MKVYVLFLRNKEDEWQIEGLYDSESKADLRLLKIAKDKDYNEADIDAYMTIETHLLT